MKRITENDFIAFEKLKTPSLMVQTSVEMEGDVPMATVLVQILGREWPTAFTTDLETLAKISKQFDKVAQKTSKSVEQNN